jgi:general secretion pathway protein G
MNTVASAQIVFVRDVKVQPSQSTKWSREKMHTTSRHIAFSRRAMVIIGLLAGFVGPKYFSQIGKSEIKAARAQLDGLGKALDQFRLDTGHYPATEQGLAALVVRPTNEPKWDGPYLTKAVPLDPWGVPYVFKSPGEHSDYDLSSYGKDKQPGGEGEAADINNW